MMSWHYLVMKMQMKDTSTTLLPPPPLLLPPALWQSKSAYDKYLEEFAKRTNNPEF